MKTSDASRDVRFRFDRTAASGRWCGLALGAVVLSKGALMAQPANDHFANATVVGGTWLRIVATNVGATKETGEPNHSGVAGGHSIWWRWSAPVPAPVVVSTVGSSFTALLGVYTGNSVGTLTPVGTMSPSSIVFQATAGTSYWIAVDSAGGATGSVRLNLDALAFSVSILAGSPGSGGGADGTGSAARFDFPAGVAVDSSGNVFVAESGNHTIRAIAPTAAVTTVAGTAGMAGTANSTGVNARFNAPSGVALDAAGNLFVADTQNHAIRMITPDLVVRTYAGEPGLRGTADSAGTGARFDQPVGLALDDMTGVIYVADCNNHTIRKIARDRTVTTLAGSPGLRGSTDGAGTAARFFSPYGVALGRGGELFVADNGNHTVRKITAAGVVTTLAGSAGVSGSADGMGTAARFHSPAGVALDAWGNVYVADNGNRTVRRITPEGLVVTLPGTAGSSPFGVAVDAAGTLYFANFSNHTVHKAVPLAAPMMIGRQPLDVEVVTSENATFAVVATATTFQWQRSTDSGTTWVSLTDGSSFAGTATPQLTVNTTTTTMSGDLFRVVVSNGVTAFLYSASARLSVGPAYEVSTLAGGTRGNVDGTGSAARFAWPAAVAVASDGNLFVADNSNGSIRKITPAGAVTTVATGLDQPQGVAVGSDATVYVVDTYHNVVRRLSPTGALTILAGSPAFSSGSADGAGSNARFFHPRGITVAADNVYVADSSNDTIRRIVLPNTVTTLAGTAGAGGFVDGAGPAARFHRPTGMAADAAGNLYVADYWSDAIRKITPAGLVTTVAGAIGTGGFADGPAASAIFYHPSGVAVDATGNLFVADSWNHVIRKISPAGVVTTIAGAPGQQGFVDGRHRTARFLTPCGVAVGVDGTLFVADTENDRIRKAVLVYDRPGIKSPLIASGTLGEPFHYTIAANSNPQRYGAEGLPAGLQIDTATGVISGRPAATGNFIVGIGATNGFGSTKEPLALEIRAAPPPTITAQPAAVSAPNGTTARFTVAATGVTALSYRWQTATAGSATWGDVNDDNTFSGATTTTLTVAATMNLTGRQFRVIVRDANGGSTMSSAVTLTVTLPPPLITTQPVATSVTSGTSAQFTVGASSAASLSYAWQTFDGTDWIRLTDGSIYSGTTTSALTVAATTTLNTRQFRVVVNDAYGGITTSAAVVLTVTLPSRLVNLSTRGQCLTADNVLIPGFVITGSAGKRLLIRVVGPTLAAFGVGGALSDPTMVLKRFVSGSYIDVAVNNDWESNPNAADIVAASAHCGAFALPAGSRDAVLLLELPAGQYTVVASGAGTSTGVAIVELYDTGGNSDTSRLANIATRGYVGTGDAIMIPGFVVSNEGARTLLIRAVGPTLASLGVAGALADPRLVVYRQDTDGSSTAIFANDDWGLDASAATTASTASQVGAFALGSGSKDAAIVVSLQPGVYTVQASGAGNTTGTALVEVYEVP